MGAWRLLRHASRAVRGRRSPARSRAWDTTKSSSRTPRASCCAPGASAASSRSSTSAARAHLLMVGPAANEAVFRAPDDQLSPSPPYRFMVPVFGEGIQFGAPLEIERQQVKMQSSALRLERMRGYAQVIAREVEAWVARLGRRGREGLLRRVQGARAAHLDPLPDGVRVPREAQRRVRRALPRPRAGGLAGVDRRPLRAVRDLRAARSLARAARGDHRRRRARAAARRRRPPGHARRPSWRPSIWTAAGSASTRSSAWSSGSCSPASTPARTRATWTIVELARNPRFAPEIAREVDSVYAPGGELGFAALRELPLLERFLFETLRLHPPLVTLMRRVLRDFAYADVVVPEGDTHRRLALRGAPHPGALPRAGALRSVARAIRRTSSPTSRSAAAGASAWAMPSRVLQVQVDHERAALALRVRARRPARDRIATRCRR